MTWTQENAYITAMISAEDVMDNIKDVWVNKFQNYVSQLDLKEDACTNIAVEGNNYILWSN